LSEKKYGYREAAQSDFEFMYRVMVTVRSPHRTYNEQEERAKFAKNFKLEGLHVIEHGRQDVGRLRFLLNDEHLYLGGIQILPAFQRKGIGSAILFDLIRDAANLGVDVTLEVHTSNTDAQRLYRKLGFVEVGQDPHCSAAIKMCYFTKR